MRTLALVILAVPALAATPTLTPPSRVDAVTVYLQSARVTRVARVESARRESCGPRGAPGPELDDDSIRVEGKGGERAPPRRERRAGDVPGGAGGRGARPRGAARAAPGRRPCARGRAAPPRRARSSSSRSARPTRRSARRTSPSAGVLARVGELAGHVERELLSAAAAVQADAARAREEHRAGARRSSKGAGEARRTTKSVGVDVEAERDGVLELAVSLRGRVRRLAADLGRAAGARALHDGADVPRLRVAAHRRGLVGR